MVTITDEDDLMRNFRQQLCLYNEKKLNGIEFTDKELLNSIGV